MTYCSSSPLSRIPAYLFSSCWNGLSSLFSLDTEPGSWAEFAGLAWQTQSIYNTWNTPTQSELTHLCNKKRPFSMRVYAFHFTSVGILFWQGKRQEFNSNIMQDETLVIFLKAPRLSSNTRPIDFQMDSSALNRRVINFLLLLSPS